MDTHFEPPSSSKADTSLQPVALNSKFLQASTPDVNLNLIVIHGLFGSAAVFASVLNNKRILDYANCYLLDLRNHGDSPHTDSMSLQDMTQDVYQHVESLKLKDIVLMGHSIGGRIAMQYCVSYPEKVKGVIVLDVMPTHYPEEKEKFPFVERMQMILQNVQGMSIDQSKEEIKRQITEWEPQNESLVNNIMTNLVELGENSYKWRVNMKSINKNYFEFLRGPFVGEKEQKYNGEVKVIFGEKSLALGADVFECYKRVFQYFEYAKNVEFIKNAKHWIHLDNPEDFVEAVASFLVKISQL